MKTITIETIPASPDLCKIVINSGNGDIDEFTFNVAEAIQLRNELTSAIDEYQTPFLYKHLSNSGNEAIRLL